MRQIRIVPQNGQPGTSSEEDWTKKPTTADEDESTVLQLFPSSEFGRVFGIPRTGLLCWWGCR